jgi:hypothetical protein
MSKRHDMKKLIEERDRLRTQIESLKSELRGIERAIALLSGEDVNGTATPATRGRAKNVKDTVLGFLAEAGAPGLSVTKVMEMAQRRGFHVERGSVSSLLSRLKREGVLDLKDGAYTIRRPGPREGTSQSVQTH